MRVAMVALLAAASLGLAAYGAHAVSSARLLKTAVLGAPAHAAGAARAGRCLTAKPATGLRHGICG